MYCGTHTPQGYENLEAKRVMDLDNPVPTIWPDWISENRKQPENMSAPSVAKSYENALTRQ